MSNTEYHIKVGLFTIISDMGINALRERGDFNLLSRPKTQQQLQGESKQGSQGPFDIGAKIIVA